MTIANGERGRWQQAELLEFLGDRHFFSYAIAGVPDSGNEVVPLAKLRDLDPAPVGKELHILFQDQEGAVGSQPAEKETEIEDNVVPGDLDLFLSDQSFIIGSEDGNEEVIEAGAIEHVSR